MGPMIESAASNRTQATQQASSACSGLHAGEGRLMPMRYYDLQKNWTKKIEPHLANKQLNNILVRDLNKRSSSQWGKPFVHGQYPWEYGEFEWMIERKGRPPRYWRYTQTGACHWLVNFNLKLATLVEPQQRWRIVTSAKHSTVWDGAEMLFEFNFLAFGVPADECFKRAFEGGTVRPPGKFRRTYTTPHYSVEIENLRKARSQCPLV
jgi:hypothetical protein